MLSHDDEPASNSLRTELIARARALAPLLARNAGTTEAGRRIVDDNIAAIRELFPGCVTEAKDENGNLHLTVDFDQLCR